MATTTTPRLKTKYREEIAGKLRDEFKYENVMQIPGLVKIVVNMGVGDAARDSKLIEGAIRIKVLLDNYDSALSLTPHTQVFQQLYQATAHVPTHAGWKALSRDERRQHEARFAELSEAYQQQAHDAARWLLDEGLAARQ